MGAGARRLEILVGMDTDRCDDGGACSSRRIPFRIVACSLAAVSIVTLWMFRPVLNNGFVQWDDQIYLGELMRLGRFSWSSLWWMWTSLQPFYLQPIAWMTNLADYQVWGLDPVGHHATNWVLHGVYVALVGTLIWLLTGKVANMRPTERLATCVGIALVCGIHPLQVESVAWVAARNGLLCSLWMVAALCAYVRAVGNDGDRRRGWWWTTVALDAVALLTKPFAVSLPAVMLAMDYFPLRRLAVRGSSLESTPPHLDLLPRTTGESSSSPLLRKGEGRGEGSFGATSPIKRFALLVGEKWPMIALSALASIGAIGARVQMHELPQDPLEMRLLVAAHGLAFYWWKLAWPSWLSPFYPFSNHVSLWDKNFLPAVLFCAAVTIVAAWGWKRTPVLAAAWGSYLALLLPVCGLVQVGGQAMADRYAYLAMVPVLLGLGSGLLWLWRRGPAPIKVSLCVVVGAWLALLGLWTRAQIAVWHDDISLWRAALKHFPDDPHSNYDLGVALLEAHRLEEARAAVERAIAHSDPHTAQLPMAHGTLGTIYLKMHQYNAAVEQLQEAVASDATLWAARYNLACAYARMGRLAQAYDELKALVTTQPGYASLAARDGELMALRDDPQYRTQFAELVSIGRK
jgi:tetratricopeptide (TPR) repeat protein